MAHHKKKNTGHVPPGNLPRGLEAESRRAGKPPRGKAKGGGAPFQEQDAKRRLGDFATGSAVQELESYLQSIYARYHLPIWVTEFALTNFGGGTATFPTEAQQAAFLTAATKMLDGLSYVQRYAWFALPTSSGSGTTGLFDPGPSVTPVGRAFESAR